MKIARTLRLRMIVSLGLMVLGTIAIGAAAIAAVNGLHQDLGVATRGYRQLRQLIGVGFLASKAREALTANPPQPAEASAALQAALVIVDQRSEGDLPADQPVVWIDESARKDCERLISQAIGDRSPTSLNRLFSELSRVSDEVRQTIADAQSAADHKRRLTLECVIALCIAIAMAAIVVGIGQYRSVVGPVRRIGGGVRAFATGDFELRIVLTGDAEFMTLAADFNMMADQLSALYRDLEQQVRNKTRELVRAEQLAAVGYLAAGVAHEINNPLGIIAGYAERAMQQMPADANDPMFAKAQTALSIICEEAFRCKQITDRLLSLAKPQTQERQLFSVATIADQVVANLAGLGSPGQRSLSLHVDGPAEFTVLASEGELKQVILNLLINAIEAVDPFSGQIQVNVSRQGSEIELSVIDNGQGIAAETVDRVFEPFFSQKRGQRSGTGLGLSIAHAIVIDHGGRIDAASGGPGKGSTFTIRLPAAVTGANVAIA
jgi:two-component system NtrC family sensor kinase